MSILGGAQIQLLTVDLKVCQMIKFISLLSSEFVPGVWTFRSPSNLWHENLESQGIAQNVTSVESHLSLSGNGDAFKKWQIIFLMIHKHGQFLAWIQRAAAVDCLWYPQPREPFTRSRTPLCATTSCALEWHRRWQPSAAFITSSTPSPSSPLVVWATPLTRSMVQLTPMEASVALGSNWAIYFT